MNSVIFSNFSIQNCKIYLCGTKVDLVKSNSECRQIKSQMVMNYANVIGSKYYETSSKDGECVNELFTEIAKDYLELQKRLSSTQFSN